MLFRSSRSFFAAALSSCVRKRSPGRPPVDGAGASVTPAPGRAGPGRKPGPIGRNGPLPLGRRAGVINPGAAARGGAPFPPCPGIASPGRGATPGRPGRPMRGPGDAEAAVVGGGGRRATDGWPVGTGRSWGIDSAAGRTAGARRGGGSATGRSAAGGTCGGGAAARGAVPVTGRRRVIGDGGGAAFGGAFGAVRGAAAGAAGAAGFGLTGASLGFKSTLRTKSAI